METIGKIVYTILTFGINRYIEKKKSRGYDLSHHPFFGRMKYYINAVIPHIKIDGEEKRKILLKFLNIKFKVFHNAYVEFIKIKHSNEYNCKNRIEWFIHNIETYENECRRNGIPEIFIERFSEWHTPHIENTIEGVEYIWQGQFHRRYNDKLAAELDIVQAAFAFTIIDAERTINSLNGDLDEWIRKNRVVK